MKSLRKFLFIGTVTIVLGLALTACGEKTASQKKAGSVGTNPEGVIVFNGTKNVSAASQETPYDINTFTVYLLAADTSVYSAPDTKASVLGTLTAQQEVSALQIPDNSEWYAAAYNGRIAYIPASSFQLIEEPVQNNYDYIYFEEPNYNQYYTDTNNQNTTVSNSGNQEGNTSEEVYYIDTPPADDTGTPGADTPVVDNPDNGQYYYNPDQG